MTDYPRLKRAPTAQEAAANAYNGYPIDFDASAVGEGMGIMDKLRTLIPNLTPPAGWDQPRLRGDEELSQSAVRRSDNAIAGRDPAALVGATPESNSYGQTPAPPGWLPTAKAVARQGQRRQMDPLSSALATYQTQLRSQAEAELALARQGSAMSLEEIAARERRAPNMEEAYNALLARNKRAPVDPLRASNEGGSAPVFRALAEIGPALLGHGNIQKGLADFGARTSANWTAEETRSADERKQSLLEGVTGLGFKEKDIARMDAAGKERLAAMLAALQANALPGRAVVEGGKAGLDTSLKQEELANRLKVANIAAGDRSPSLNTVAGAEWLSKQTPEVRGAISSALHPKTPRAEKFDKNEYEAAATAAQAIAGGIKDPKRRQAALAAWQVDAVDPEIGPQEATKKLYGYTNQTVGK